MGLLLSAFGDRIIQKKLLKKFESCAEERKRRLRDVYSLAAGLSDQSGAWQSVCVVEPERYKLLLGSRRWVVQTLTTIFPVFLPVKRPANASGVFSKPSTTVSSYFTLPSLTS